MSLLKKRADFLGTAEAEEVKQVLRSMVQSDVYKTTPTYTTNTQAYPDNRIPFVDKHIEYLSRHPNLDIDQYLSNLRLSTHL